MIKFTKKWGHVYAPPGGKFESGESPLDCIIREFYEETGLTLINPRLQGMDLTFIGFIWRKQIWILWKSIRFQIKTRRCIC